MFQTFMVMEKSYSLVIMYNQEAEMALYQMTHPVFGRTGIEDLTPKQLLSCYLQWSYLYYIRMESAVDDSVYDKASTILLDRMAEWEDHPHSHLVTEGDLRAGTLFMLKASDYPTIVAATSEDWIRPEFREGYEKYRT